MSEITSKVVTQVEHGHSILAMLLTSPKPIVSKTPIMKEAANHQQTW